MALALEIVGLAIVGAVGVALFGAWSLARAANQHVDLF